MSHKSIFITRAGEPEPLEKKKQEPEPLGKKSGAGAAKKSSVSDPLKETLIWIRVPKKNCDKLAYKLTKIIKI